MNASRATILAVAAINLALPRLLLRTPGLREKVRH